MYAYELQTADYASHSTRHDRLLVVQMERTASAIRAHPWHSLITRSISLWSLPSASFSKQSSVSTLQKNFRSEKGKLDQERGLLFLYHCYVHGCNEMLRKDAILFRVAPSCIPLFVSTQHYLNKVAVLYRFNHDV